MIKFHSICAYSLDNATDDELRKKHHHLVRERQKTCVQGHMHVFWNMHILPGLHNPMLSTKQVRHIHGVAIHES